MDRGYAIHTQKRRVLLTSQIVSAVSNKCRTNPFAWQERQDATGIPYRREKPEIELAKTRVQRELPTANNEELRQRTKNLESRNPRTRNLITRNVSNPDPKPEKFGK